MMRRNKPSWLSIISHLGIKMTLACIVNKIVRLQHYSLQSISHNDYELFQNNKAMVLLLPHAHHSQP